MKKTITIIKKDPPNISDSFNGKIETDIIFQELQRDTIGKSGSSPTWGDVYLNQNGKLEYLGIALHKGYDYDWPKAAYGEKAWSIMGKALLDGKVRVPNIDIVEDKSRNEGIISYRLMNNDKEDMIHIKDTLFNKFEREEIKSKKDIFALNEILECVKLQIGNEENYGEVEKGIINVLMLDSITNNGDRHALNWALVRDKITNRYELAAFDHSSAFVDMFEDKSYILGRGWNSTYITVDDNKKKNYIGNDGEKILRYISKTYPEYFEEFCDNFDEKLPSILEKIRKENMKIDFNRLVKKLEEKKRFLKKLRDRGELEYE